MLEKLMHSAVKRKGIRQKVYEEINAKIPINAFEQLFPDYVLNFFSSGEKMKTPQEVEAERNLKKALNMADGFPPLKTNEDFKFLDKWLFNDLFFFFFPKKMNPETISIPDCHLDTPVKRSSGKISFCLIPCLNNDKKLQVKLKTKFKIFAHQEDSFSLGITIPEEQLDFFKDLEQHLNTAAMTMKKEIAKLGSFCQISGRRFCSCEN